MIQHAVSPIEEANAASSDADSTQGADRFAASFGNKTVRGPTHAAWMRGTPVTDDDDPNTPSEPKPPAHQRPGCYELVIRMRSDHEESRLPPHSIGYNDPLTIAAAIRSAWASGAGCRR